MITELTKEQEQKIPFYYDKWHKIGHTYKPINQNKAKKILKEYLSVVNLHPTKFIFCDSPMACQIAINMYDIEQQLKGKVISDGQKLSEAFRDISNNFEFEYYTLGYFWQSGNIRAGYCALYDFLIEEVQELDAETMKLWNIFKKITEELHYFFVFEDVVFLSGKPTELHFNEQDELHCETGPAVRYADGFELYSLNGVSVSKEIVMTPAENLDPKLVLTESNVAVKAQLVKKIGIESVVELIDGTVLDTMESKVSKENYILYRMDIGDGIIGNFLKLVCNSTGEITFEGVPDERDTVKKAIMFRNNLSEFEEPAVLT